MENAAWEIVEEHELRRFLRGAKPDWRANDLAAAESKLRRVEIESVETLLQALTVVVGTRVILDEMFETEDLVPFSSSTVKALREQAQRPLPRARTAVQPKAPEEEPAGTRAFARFFEGEDGEEGQGQGEEAGEHVPQRRGPRAGHQRKQDPITLKEKRLEACRRQGAAAAAAEIEAAWRDENTHEQDETFEVLASEVLVREAPRDEAPTIGILHRGEFIQVRPRRLWDTADHEWVELSYLELLRSCPSAGNGAVLLGYALIDASHLGLGRLLRGPITRVARPDPAAPTPEPAAEPAQEGSAEGTDPAPAHSSEPVQPATEPVVTPEAAPVAPPQPTPQDSSGPTPKQRPSRSGTKAPKLLAQLFTVSRAAGAVVREGPSASELQVCWLEEGAQVELEEETFDGWARLVGEGGWVRRRAFQGGEVVVHLTPVGKPPLLASVDVSAEPGPRRFEVIFRPRLGVKAAPRATARLLGNKAFGEYVLALTQTYDGWVRLAGEGWMPGIGRESGQMLR